MAKKMIQKKKKFILESCAACPNNDLFDMCDELGVSVKRYPTKTRNFHPDCRLEDEEACVEETICERYAKGSLCSKCFPTEEDLHWKCGRRPCIVKYIHQS